MVGEGNGGKAALLIAAELPEGKLAGVAVCDAPADWPFDGLAPSTVIDRYSGALLLTVSENNAEALYAENEQMAALRHRRQLPVTLVSLEDSSGNVLYDKFRVAFEKWRQETNKETKNNGVENR